MARSARRSPNDVRNLATAMAVTGVLAWLLAFQSRFLVFLIHYLSGYLNEDASFVAVVATMAVLSGATLVGGLLPLRLLTRAQAVRAWRALDWLRAAPAIVLTLWGLALLALAITLLAEGPFHCPEDMICD